MVRPRPALALPLVLTGALLVSPPAGTAAPSAEPPPGAPTASGWTRLSSAPSDSLGDITTLRTADGVLHAVYKVDAGGAEAYEQARISSTGDSLGTGLAFAPWTSLVGNPKLVPGPGGGIRLVFSGLQNTDSANFYSAGFMYEALADASGTSFAVQPRALTRTTIAYAGYGTGAVTLDDGRPMSSTTLNSDVFFRAGSIDSTDRNVINASAPDGITTQAACCAYQTTLVKSGGTVWMAWYGNGGTESTNGVFVQQVYPAAGPVLKAPGSSVGTDSIGIDQTVAATTRPDGSVVLAYQTGYPTATGIDLWQVGTGSAVKVPGTANADLVALDSGDAGRLWLAWSDYSDDAVSVLRSGETGFTMGGRLDLGKPGQEVDRLSVDTSDAQATVLVNSTGAVSYRQVEPAPIVKAAKSVKAGPATKVRFTVKDAGAGVKGAKVRAAGRSCTTNAKGVCRLKVGKPRPGKVKVKITRAGYATITQTIKVKR